MYSTPLIAVAFFLFLLKKSWEKVLYDYCFCAKFMTNLYFKLCINV